MIAPVPDAVQPRDDQRDARGCVRPQRGHHLELASTEAVHGSRASTFHRYVAPEQGTRDLPDRSKSDTPVYTPRNYYTKSVIGNRGCCTYRLRSQP